MALAMLLRAFKMILEALHKFKITHLNAEMININIWVLLSFS